MCGTLHLHAVQAFERALKRIHRARVLCALGCIARSGVLNLCEFAFQLDEESIDHVVHPCGIDVVGRHAAGAQFGKRKRPVRQRRRGLVHVQLHLWGYGVIGDGRDSVQVRGSKISSDFGATLHNIGARKSPRITGDFSPH